MSEYNTKPTLILVEGADQAGKSTLINRLTEKHGIALLEFPKSDNTKPFKIETKSELSCYVSMSKNLDKSIIWVQDRGILSNIVYNRNFLKHDIDEQLSFLHNLNDNTNLLIVILDRPHIKSNFKDDLLDVSMDKFNLFVDSYRTIDLDDNFNVLTGKILNDDFVYDNNELERILSLIDAFIKKDS